MEVSAQKGFRFIVTASRDGIEELKQEFRRRGVRVDEGKIEDWAGPEVYWHFFIPEGDPELQRTLETLRDKNFFVPLPL